MKCSKCNVEISDDAKFCPVCGAKVEPENKCPNCGEKLDNGAKFCTKCGTKIEKCNEGKEISSSTSEDSVIEAAKTTIVNHNVESSTVNASKPLPITNSSSMPVKNNKSAKKAVIIIAFVFVVVTIVALVSEYVISLVSNSDSQSNYYSGNSYGYSSNSNLSKTYSNRFISFNYPSNYKITDEESGEDGEIILNCEIKGDDLSIITITSGEEESLYFLDEQDINETCKEALRSINDELVSNIMYNNVKFRIMSKQKIGNCTGYISDFTANVYSYPIKGYTFVGISGYYYVTIFTQAENDKYMSQLDDILSTLDVKAIALGIGDMPDDDM